MWQLLMEIVLLLAVAFLLGAIAQRFKQSAIIGYLLAGVIIGPWLFNARAVEQVAELGVALLLFSIGLEFSFSRLKQLGPIALVGGSLQVLISLVFFSLLFHFFTDWSVAIALGAMVALSSTAVVLRVLVDQTAIDSIHGRNALGILLLQDVAVVPLMLLVTILSQGGGAEAVTVQLGKTMGGAFILVALFYLIFYHLVPRILMAKGLFSNRELVVLLAIIIALGSIWIAHTLGLSPALGAFLAGMLLAESPFATQIRSDIGSIRTLFVTLFFTSVGMLADPVWFVTHVHWVFFGLLLVFGAKSLIIYAIVRFFKNNSIQALSTGFTLAQIGEFSFVLATTAHGGGLISSDQFALVVSVTILSMFFTPLMVTNAEKWARLSLGHLFRAKGQPIGQAWVAPAVPPRQVLIIGFGPAGQQVARALKERDVYPRVIELNPKSAAMGKEMNLSVHLGDATNSDILNHAGIENVCAVVITLPDPKTCRDVITNLKLLDSEIPIIARSRYHRFAMDLEKSGATIVVDEESYVGQALANNLFALLKKPNQTAMACALAAEKPI